MKATISERIKEGMRIRNLKQVDLVEKTGINKATLSQYKFQLTHLADIFQNPRDTLDEFRLALRVAKFLSTFVAILDGLF